MASQEELKYQQELREQLEETLFLQRSFTDEILSSAKAVFGVSETAKKASKSFRDISNLSQQVADSMKEVVAGQKDINSLKNIEKKRLESIQSLNTNLNLTAGSILYRYRDSVEEIKKQVDVTGKLEKLKKAIDIHGKSLSLEQRRLLELYKEQYETLVLQEQQSEKIKTHIEEMDKITGGSTKFAEGFDGVMKKLGGGKFSEALGIEDAIKNNKKYASSLLEANGGLSKGGDKLRVMGNLVTNLGKNLLKALGPIFLIVQLVQGLVQADKETVKLQKSMALTRSEAVSFRNNIAQVASDTGDINITSSKLLETYSQLNDQFGFITNFSGETLATTTKLVNVVGIAANSAGNLAAMSSLTGRSFNSNYKSVLGTSHEIQRQYGVQLDLTKVLEQTGNVTGQVRANLGANPKAIAAAITQAKMFGAELDDIASASKALLDFESSITAELEAELMLGRNLNLEKARLAALTGDQVTLAKELSKQAGNFTDFQNMNVLQQEALAKAMGMSSDKLSDILFQQQVQKRNSKELFAAGEDELAKRVEAQELGEKFNATMDKLKGMFTDIAANLMPVLEIFGAILSVVGAIVGLIGDIGRFLKEGDTNFSGFLGGMESAGSMFGGALGIADDAIIPAGYGETIVKSPKGTVALNNQDQVVVAGTNLNQGNSSNDMKETNMLLKQILSKQGEVRINSTKIGDGFSINSFNIQ